jgi:hypothetical protein
MNHRLAKLLLVLNCFVASSVFAQVKVTITPGNAPIPTRLAAKRFTFHLTVSGRGGEQDLGGVPNQQLFGAQVLLQNVNFKNFDSRKAIRAVVFPNQPASLTVSCGEGSQTSQIKLAFTFVYQPQPKAGGSADFIHVNATRTPEGQKDCDVGGQVDLIILPTPRG